MYSFGLIAISPFFFDGSRDLLRVLVVTPILYLAVILLVRLSGKRSTSQMNNFDWILTVAMGSIVASPILLDNVTLAETVLSIVMLLLLQFIVTKLTLRSELLANLVKASPTLMVRNGELLEENMRKERVVKPEILAAVRESGLADLSQVGAVVLESDANLSVVPSQTCEEASSPNALAELNSWTEAVPAKSADGPPDQPSDDGILETIGDTPLVRLRHLLDRDDIRLFAKLEFANPGGSAKDRPATRMLSRALEEGRIDRETLIVESSSGNMGIGLAQFCRYHGLRFRCVVDPRAQPLNLAILKAFGAEVDRVEKPDAETGDFLTARLQRVQEILRATPNSFWPDQYTNPENPRSHETGTMREIDEALGGEVDYVFVATSSTGTAGGCWDYLREQGRKTRVVAVDAVGSVLFGGTPSTRRIPGLGAGVLPPLARDRRFDRVVRVSDAECVVGCRRLVARESILAGGSAGGVVQAVRKTAAVLPRGATCVAILADGGVRYLDTVFDDGWVRSELDCTPEELERRIASADAETPAGAEA